MKKNEKNNKPAFGPPKLPSENGRGAGPCDGAGEKGVGRFHPDPLSIPFHPIPSYNGGRLRYAKVTPGCGDAEVTSEDICGAENNNKKTTAR